MPSYKIHRTPEKIAADADFFSPQWDIAQIARINNFLAESSSHRPEASAKFLYDNDGIYGKYFVRDKYVKAVHRGYNSPVCKDSCVEFFIEPPGGGGYVNFEMNCGGSVLAYHVRDWTRTADAFVDYSPLSSSELDLMQISHSLPETVDPEIVEAVDWQLGFFIPFIIFEKVFGSSRDELLSSPWRGNFYKCADESSMPHWASWSPVWVCNFHTPEYFGEILFD